MRAFIAINFADDVREGIADVSAQLKRRVQGVAWVPTAAVHLTLKFLGNVDPNQATTIIDRIGHVASTIKPFAMVLEGAGAFPHTRRPKVVWIGCLPDPGLELLQHHLEVEMDRLGFPAEHRPFRPHVTIGRVRDPIAAAPGIKEALETVTYQANVEVDSVDLMESHLRSAGARYRVLSTASLKA